MVSDAVLKQFLDDEGLPDHYLDIAKRHFLPVAVLILQQAARVSGPYLVAINGSQGSGKTTLASLFCRYFNAQGKQVLSLSIDDFYLTKTQRQNLADHIHPLLATRGVPGTHDTEKLSQVLSAIKQRKSGYRIPRFDKATDDRMPEADWHHINTPLDMVILEGWCWGAKHQPAEALLQPVNSLEAEEDTSRVWRTYVNTQIAQCYEPLYTYMDCWLMLKAPSFDCVYQWRLEQEKKLAQRMEKESAADASGLMSPTQIARFIQHYQRVTQQVLVTLPDSADVVWSLDERREVQAKTWRLPATGKGGF